MESFIEIYFILFFIEKTLSIAASTLNLENVKFKIIVFDGFFSIFNVFNV